MYLRNKYRLNDIVFNLDIKQILSNKEILLKTHKRVKYVYNVDTDVINVFV